MDTGDIISSFLSSLAIILTIVMYLKHDKRLKKQEEMLNAYQLKKIEEEESESKKAQVRGNLIKGLKGRRDLRVYNTGKSPAKNIIITFMEDSDKNVTTIPYSSPFEFLNTNDHFDIIMYPIVSATHVLKVKLTWEDDFSKVNEHIQHFKLV